MAPESPKIESVPKELTAEDAAELLGVDPRTVRNRIKRGELVGVKVNGKWFVDTSSLTKPVVGVGSAEARTPPRTTYSIDSLAAFRLCCHAFDQFPLSLADQDLDRHIKLKRTHIIEALGAGYYSYGPAKQIYYGEARGHLGGLVALLKSRAIKDKLPEQPLKFLEQECLPAVGSLIRKIENKNTNKGRT